MGAAFMPREGVGVAFMIRDNLKAVFGHRDDMSCTQYKQLVWLMGPEGLCV